LINLVEDLSKEINLAESEASRVQEFARELPDILRKYRSLISAVVKTGGSIPLPVEVFDP